MHNMSNVELPLEFPFLTNGFQPLHEKVNESQACNTKQLDITKDANQGKCNNVCFNASSKKLCIATESAESLQPQLEQESLSKRASLQPWNQIDLIQRKMLKPQFFKTQISTQLTVTLQH